jgi:hypothetical protein
MAACVKVRARESVEAAHAGMMSMLKSYLSHVLVLFSNVMDGLGSCFSPQKSLWMSMASNKSSKTTVMRERVLDVVLLNDVSLEFAKSTLTASQNRNCPYFVGFGKFLDPSSPNLLEEILMIVNCHKRRKEEASKILCDFACHGIQSCSSDITLQWVHVIEFLQLNQQE